MTKKPESRSDNSKKKPQPKKKRKWGKRLFWWSFFTVALAVFCAIAGFLFIILNGERILAASGDDPFIMDETSIVYDINGNEVSRLFAENREPVKYSELPEMVVDAFVATEDRRFFEHQGVDLWSIGRAAVKDVIARSAVEGGSTITQQLAKNLFLSMDKTFFRKATEVSIALALENHKTKEEILELYLNRINFGKGAYGIKAASKRYFGKENLDDLELWEIATLAGIPKAPTHYNPINQPEKSKNRRAVILKLMYDQGYITAEQMNEAAAVEYDPDKAQVAKHSESTIVDYAIAEAEEVSQLTEDELRRGGYKIYTTMDAGAQKAMEAAFENDDLFEKSPEDQQVQGAMVITDHHTGGIVAMVGGRDYVRKGLNRTLVPRQPGSAFKPIASFGPALETGEWFPWSMLSDEKQCFGDYCPSNLSKRYSGQMPLNYALQQSINIPAVWLLNEIGVKQGYEFAKKLGIPLDKDDRNLAIALGGLTHGATPLQMADAYSAFANGGKYLPSYSVVRIEDRNGKTVYQYKQPKGERVMSEKTAYYMTELLQQVVNEGTAKRAKLDRPVAGKTGTAQHGIKGFNSSANRDVWFVGYTPEWTAAVWMGYDKTDRQHVLKNGSGQAATMFKEVMSKALKNHEKKKFEKPEGIDEVKEPDVQKVTGLTAEYSVQTGLVTLNWNALSSDHEVTYRIYRKEDTESKATLVGEVVSNEFEDINVYPNATYEYYVTAYIAALRLETEPSGKVKLTIDSDLPPIDTLPPDTTDPGQGTAPPPGEWIPGEEPDFGDGSQDGSDPANGGQGNGGNQDHGGNNGNGHDNGNNGNNGNGNGNGNNRGERDSDQGMLPDGSINGGLGDMLPNFDDPNAGR